MAVCRGDGGEMLLAHINDSPVNFTLHNRINLSMLHNFTKHTPIATTDDKDLSRVRNIRTSKPSLDQDAKKGEYV
jgi:hypothetical protein